MRHAISATLLGWAVLAHAAPPTNQKVPDEQQWTRVDLDDAPSLFIGSPAISAKAGKAPAESKGQKQGKNDDKKPSSGLSKIEIKSTPPIVTSEISPGISAARGLEPAQEQKAIQKIEAHPVATSAKQEAEERSRIGSAAIVPVTPEVKTPVLPTKVVQENPSVAAHTSAGPAQSTKVEPAQPGNSLQSPKKVDVALEPVKLPPAFLLTAKDRTIRAGLERWATSAGWKLSWELDEKFQNGGVVRFDADFGTDFDTALSKLAGAIRSEVKTHAFLYVGNKVLRIMEEPSKPVVQQAVPMTPMLLDGAQKDSGDKGLAYVTRVKGYWLGASGTESDAAPAHALPPIFNASVSLLFSDKASLGTVTGILSKVTGIAILLPGAIEYPSSSLFVNDSADQKKKKKTPEMKSKQTYVGTPRALLDRISVSTGMLWEYKDETIVFSE